MPISLTTLLAALCSIYRSRAALELENLALRHPIGVLQRSARKRPRLTSGDRLLWVCLSLLWRDWRSTLAIVKPETVVAWHRKGFRLLWTGKVRRGQPGRPVISREARDRIRKMCRGIVLNEPIGALARLQIGRAYALQGDTVKARTAYKDFLTIWKDADADIPILKEAEAEYAKLQ